MNCSKMKSMLGLLPLAFSLGCGTIADDTYESPASPTGGHKQDTRLEVVSAAPSMSAVYDNPGQGDKSLVGAEAQQTLTPTPRCLVFTDSYYKGRVLEIRGDIPNLHYIKSGSWWWDTWGDIISSIQCDNGGWIRVFIDDSYRGDQTIISGWVDTLHQPRWGSYGDNISSVMFMH